MPTLLIVHHTPSPSLQAMFEAVLAGATTDEIEDVEVVRRPAACWELGATVYRPGIMCDISADLRS